MFGTKRVRLLGPQDLASFSQHLAEIRFRRSAGRAATPWNRAPRVGPTGEERTFHSFRHTFARIALEHGAELTWLSRHLGHSSTAVRIVRMDTGRARGTEASVERLGDAFSV